MSAVSVVLKQRVAKILRQRVKSGLNPELADIVKKDMFDILNDSETMSIISVLLAAVIDREVNEFVKQSK
jgi:hypothetical protein